MLRAAILQADPSRHAWVPGQSPPAVSCALWGGEGEAPQPAPITHLVLVPALDATDQFPSTGYLRARQGTILHRPEGGLADQLVLSTSHILILQFRLALKYRWERGFCDLSAASTINLLRCYGRINKA